MREDTLLHIFGAIMVVVCYLLLSSGCSDIEYIEPCENNTWRCDEEIIQFCKSGVWFDHWDCVESGYSTCVEVAREYSWEDYVARKLEAYCE